ncbi:MAG: energy transducer TonB [Cyclobacteriaceae bacterium]|nr:energy transducer TonB [Cyclobacteriaceae bacterium]
MEIKKTEKADLNKKSGLFLSIGMVASLLIILTGFEWRSFDDGSLVDQSGLSEDIEELIDIPPTEQPPPPPPKLQQPQVIEVPDEEEIEEEIEIEFDTEIEEEEIVEEIVIEDEPEAEVAEEIFTIVEDPAMPVGGYAAFYEYVSKRMKYPTQARRMGIEGKVFVQFVIDKDGSITEVQAVKGIGAGCDEEAVRVVQSHPKWSPPKQRGQPVKQRIVLPITFKLN